MEDNYYYAICAINGIKECLEQVDGIRRIGVNDSITRLRKRYISARDNAIKYGVDMSEFPKTLRIRSRKNA